MHLPGQVSTQYVCFHFDCNRLEIVNLCFKRKAIVYENCKTLLEGSLEQISEIYSETLNGLKNIERKTQKAWSNQHNTR